MIKTIIFDFGDVFINIDKPATLREFSKFKSFRFTKKEQAINELYETGGISTSEFINHYKVLLPEATEEQLISAWNAILLDFPKHRLDFIQQLASEKKYKLILLSNTNELHIDWIKKNIAFYPEFKNSFNTFYLSQEIGFRKPNRDIFEFVLNQNNITPSETLFIDDTKANTDTASSLGIHIWNNNPSTEDVTNLFTIKSELF
ncbi:HAD family phosphatase [Aquimarina sp. MMG016]|uniref:HAD family hydrolase n=1 Tax=Aquimarina sp. MMG016 TaxID=2822690 RepID=UPI001B3A5C4D|nr:HAD family phosphatase [Aquimarina sp. MMG016]MBQ4821190.1 HAD family phosphatase [Aquimarina sp. MMG016]